MPKGAMQIMQCFESKSHGFFIFQNITTEMIITAWTFVNVHVDYLACSFWGYSGLEPLQETIQNNNKNSD